MIRVWFFWAALTFGVTVVGRAGRPCRSLGCTVRIAIILSYGNLSGREFFFPRSFPRAMRVLDYKAVVILGQNLKKIDICHFFKGKKSTKHAILSYFSATFQLFFPHSLRVFLKNVKCCFGFLFEKMSKLRGVENAHTWRHMVRLTRRSTMSRGKCGNLKDLKG